MIDTFPLAEAIAARIAEDADAIVRGESCELLERLTPVSAELVRYWFQDDYCAMREANFHVGQRDAILAIIYAHEVLGTSSLLDLYEKLDRQAVLAPGRLGELTNRRNDHPKYAAKMATGTGKTWVLNALLIWQYLNALAAPDDHRFTKNFLIVAPGLIVYDRLLDSFMGRRKADGFRDSLTSDIAQQVELFLPETRRATVLAFLANSTIPKEDIGARVTGGGSICLTNWHRLAGKEDPDFLAEDDADAPIAPGSDIDARAAALSFVPLTPGTNTGNSLDTLDREHGRPMEWLRSLPSLMVFNDEAHHVHSSRSGDEATEVEWQRSLTDLSNSIGKRLTQIDFSATPYNESRGKRHWFDHIVVDFALDAAMRMGLVKALALDKRQEVGAIPNTDLEFRAVRGPGNSLTLSDGQRTMLRAGLKRLEILEEQFAKQDPDKHPKMLVMVEDTTVSPLIEDFLREEGYGDDDFLRVDSGKKAELGPKDWEPVKDQLFGIDSRKTPRIVISVLMLREGFDVNNICVIVPLRSAGSGILAEQTVGRGLRLMWRGEPEIDELKAETRAKMAKRQAPANYYDVLFVVEHPRFDDLYEDLLGEGLVTEVTDDGSTATGDSERVGLRPDFEQFDFAVPFIIRDAVEELDGPRVDVLALPVSTIPLDSLLGWTGKGDKFMAEDYATRTRFGGFTIDGARFSSRGYNEYLGKLAMRIGGSITRSFTEKGTVKQRTTSDVVPEFTLQVDRAAILGWLDRYIRTRFFAAAFDPLHEEQWRVLMIDVIADQISGNLARALVESLDSEVVGEPEIRHQKISEVDSITVRASHSIEVEKCVYPKLPIPSHSGGLERLFIEWAEADTAVEALVKIHEYRHQFLQRPYIKADGMPARYSPDFLIRTADAIYVVETKATAFLDDANVKRKQNSALQWVSRINRLPAHHRSDREWHYVLLGEKTVKDWHSKGMTASAVLELARLRPPEQSKPTLF